MVGGTGLHRRIGEDGLEIGYWRRADAGGRGLVTTWSAALTRAAFALDGVERVEIHCDEANVASAAVPRRLGFTLERIEDKPIAAPGERGRSMIWICRNGQVREPNAERGVLRYLARCRSPPLRLTRTSRSRSATTRRAGCGPSSPSTRRRSARRSVAPAASRTTSDADALADVLDLSKAMAYKNSLAGLDHGGGKAVIIGDPATVKTEQLLRAYGRFLQGLGGRYITACDVGTTPTDMDVVALECDDVTGRSAEKGGSGDSGVLTAFGVHQGMLAAARHRWGADGLARAGGSGSPGSARSAAPSWSWRCATAPRS